MYKSEPVRRGMVSTWLGRVAGLGWVLAIALSAATAHAQGDGALRLEAIDVQPLPGQQVELKLNQPDFGITPYRAMLGTLKIQPEVTIRITV